MRLQKKIDYYLKNGPEKVKPISKDELYTNIINSNGGGLEALLKSPFCLSDAELMASLETLSKNLIKYYPWKLYVDIARTRNIDIDDILKNLPEKNIFYMVDENEYNSEY